MKALVTGACGFVGRHLVKVLAENNVDVVALDRNADESLPARMVQCELDNINRLPRLVQDRDIDCCIHLAWEGATGNLRGDTDIQLKNVKRTMDLCSVLPEMGINRFIGIGTLAEKDVNHYIPTDGATPNKVSCYGVAKLTAHYLSKVVCTQNGIDHIWCQLSNIYGVGDSSNNFVNFASKLMLTGGRLSFTAGEQMYDFVYITDIANAIYLAAKSAKKNTSYYVGSGHQQKLKYFIAQIRDAIDPSLQLHLGEVPFNGVALPDEEFECTKLFEDTGYRAKVSFEAGILKTVAWLKTMQEGNHG